MRNLVCILILILLASCTKREATLSPEEAARRDSTALRVAVMPTWSCLPLYYAESTGLLTDSDTNIRLLRYTAPEAMPRWDTPTFYACCAYSARHGCRHCLAWTSQWRWWP